MKVEIYSDIACPWCYVGKKRFEKALSGYTGAGSVEVVWRPFQLDPTLSADPGQAVPANEHYVKKFGPQFPQMAARVADMAKAEGITYNSDKQLVANTLDGHRLIWLAGQEGGNTLQAAVSEALFKAYFTDGANVADRAALTEVVVGAGLDRARVEAFLSSDEGTAEVKAQIQQAQAMGVSAVPTFVFEDKWVISGAQEAETFRQALAAVAAEVRSGGHTHGDACEGGSCAV